MLPASGYSANGIMHSGRITPSSIFFTTGIDKTFRTPDNLLDMLGYGDMLRRGDLRVESTKERISGVVVRYRQYHAGLPVIGGRLTIAFDRNQQPLSIYSTVTELKVQAGKGREISSEQALGIALKTIPVGDLRAGPETRKVVLPQESHSVVCWQVKLPVSKPAADLELFIDCSDGRVLLVEDRLQRIDGSGLVFIPDPVTALEDTALRDQDDDAEAIPEEAYTEVELPEISQDDEGNFVLRGPWVDTSPTRECAREQATEFYYDRQDDRFEEVMVYYHIDRQARYIRDIGFEDVLPDPLPVNVNGVEDDASFYSPQTGVLTTGSGGVDDAEDADVLVHEFGHALIESIIEDWRGGETALLKEGWCDYLAGDYSLVVDDDFQPYVLFNWDGHNEFWDGRVLDVDYTYTDIEGMEAHDAGQLWSAILFEIRRSSPARDAWNQVVLDHLFALADSATVRDAADALLLSDREITGGEFRRQIVRSCEEREVFPAGEFSPIVRHVPLGDIEDFDAERRVEITVESRFGVDESRSWLIYGFEGQAPDSALVEPADDGENLFTSVIPAPGVESDVGYYFVVTDTTGVFTTHPAGAPLVGYRYRAGPDLIPPIFVDCDSVYATIFPRGEIGFSTRVRDNIGLSEVKLLWLTDQRNWQDSTRLEPVPNTPELFMGRLRWDMENVEAVFYQVRAVDISVAQNSTHSPLRNFPLTQDALLDDFERLNWRWRLSGWERAGLSGMNRSISLRSTKNNGAARDTVAVAAPDESWDLSSFRRFRVTFWEKHLFDRQELEYGVCEVSDNEGENWAEMLDLRGSQEWWIRREIVLDEFAYHEAPRVIFRWRAVAPENADPARGWFIDNITLSRDRLVNFRDESLANTAALSLDPPFPNPANHSFRLNYNIAVPGSIRLIDLAGRTVLNLPLPTGNAQVVINLSDQPSGVYGVILDAGYEKYFQKVTLIK